MTGSRPRSPATTRGFILTGAPDPVGGLGWTRCPGDARDVGARVFAVGDIRSGSMKRVASATGEGASVVPLIHAWLNPRPVA